MLTECLGPRYEHSDSGINIDSPLSSQLLYFTECLWLIPAAHSLHIQIYDPFFMLFHMRNFFQNFTRSYKILMIATYPKNLIFMETSNSNVAILWSNMIRCWLLWIPIQLDFQCNTIIVATNRLLILLWLTSVLQWGSERHNLVKRLFLRTWNPGWTCVHYPDKT